MKCLLLPLLAALALPTSVNAEVDPKVHNLCKEVTDYMGCVKTNSKGNKWNFFQKNTIKTFKLTEEQKIKWCDFGDWSEAYMEFKVTPCIKNLEALGSNAMSKLSFDIHETCSYVGTFDSYLQCLSNLGQDISMFNKTESFLSEKVRSERWKEENKPKTKDVFVHRGKTYTASEICPYGQKTYWWISGLFRKKVTEMGCMTPEQLSLAEKAIKRNGNNALNQVNQRNFNRIILKRDQYFKPIPQPY